jgi:hypothetical protein
LIFSCGELGKQTMQFVKEYTTSRKYVPRDPIATVGDATAICLFVELSTAYAKVVPE